MLYIATTNKNKSKRLKFVLNKIFGKHLIVNDISSFSIKPPVENGKSEIENAVIKSKYYYRFIKDNVISEDVGAYFDGNNHQIAYHFNDFIKKKTTDPNKYMEQYFKTQKIEKGRFKYAYALTTRRNTFTTVFSIPFKIIKKTDKDNLVTNNVFNNFLAPIGSSVVFSKMDKVNIRNYRIENFGSRLKTFLEKIPEIFDV